jgi:hypothetical protein
MMTSNLELETTDKKAWPILKSIILRKVRCGTKVSSLELSLDIFECEALQISQILAKPKLKPLCDRS